MTTHHPPEPALLLAIRHPADRRASECSLTLLGTVLVPHRNVPRVVMTSATQQHCSPRLEAVSPAVVTHCQNKLVLKTSSALTLSQVRPTQNKSRRPSQGDFYNLRCQETAFPAPVNHFLPALGKYARDKY